MLNQVKRVLYDREYAGRLLAEKLNAYKNSDSVVLAVPHGGVPVGLELAKALRLPFEISFSKRIKHPAHSDLSIGAVSLDEVVLDEQTQNIPQHYVSHQIALLKRSLQYQYNQFYSGRKQIDLEDKTVILVDDVIRDVGQLSASLKSLEKQNPSEIVIAAPVAFGKSAHFLMSANYKFEYLFMEFNTSNNRSQHFFPEIAEEESHALVAELFSQN